jgi:hypothetical protein
VSPPARGARGSGHKSVPLVPGKTSAVLSHCSPSACRPVVATIPPVQLPASVFSQY